ncbi:MAG: nucleotidyltransferase domain-containing protein [Candidatus Krumholzibacteriota bacterium]|nr:nucleotidyltransferase domain-containing protein [Candidatus Krumholzibacteriota bacterium]
MTDGKDRVEDLIHFFREREKELECLYRIEEILKSPDAEIGEVCRGIIEAIPSGWQYPDVCSVLVTIGTDRYSTPGFVETPWMLVSDIPLQDKKAGEIAVFYTRQMPLADNGPFLRQEQRLLGTIAGRLGNFLLHQMLRRAAEGQNGAGERESGGDWEVVLNLLRHTDRSLFVTLSEKMLNHLCWTGVAEAETLRKEIAPAEADIAGEGGTEINTPHRRQNLDISDALSFRIFRIAEKRYTEDQILAYLRKWIQDDKLKYLVHVSNRNLTLAEVIGALRTYRDASPEGIELSSASRMGVVVSLIRRLLSTQLDYINVAKNYIDIRDFFGVIDRIIYTAESHGRLGGKCAGLVLAMQIIRKTAGEGDPLASIRMPKSWYITSDVLLSFLRYNNLGDVVEQKYKDINQVRVEYPHVIQTFKNGTFPPEIVQGLSVMLDDFGDRPLIIRSSSLLEDSMGAAFSGKYKSFFVANQGSKKERLDALLDAVAEVYASTFGPDPIEYRAERGLLDFNEEMAIMIQEVVGERVGDFFLPAFSGVAFSRNEFRWSPRIRREDGLIRMVPGLGTRAVDRVSDDYPVLVAPGQPGLRVNVATEEIVHYSPRKIDVINLQTNSFETMEIDELLRAPGVEYPMIEKLVSIYDGNNLRRPMAMDVDPGRDDLVFTFEGLVGGTPFVRQVDTMLKLLEEKLGTPVDIEFAHNGRDFHLLQCRPQSYSEDSVSSPIPQDTPADRTIFTAKKYISNGRVPDITHIVYVDPDRYAELPERADLVAVGRAVGQLNKLLPKRQFILMGPGRWGSRGDIKLGVSVGYADINNTAVLVEIAREKGGYKPDLSFGTHFFQDLVEGRIRYLPLFPDDDGIVFNEKFLLGSENILSEVLPEFADLAGTVRLIDVPKATGGQVLRVLMNAELGEAVGVLSEATGANEPVEWVEPEESRAVDISWVWRLRMAEHIAAQLDPERFGVAGFYVFGSTKNATAGMGSDIDIIVHFRGTKKQRADLLNWLEGWSLCLDRINYLRTGYRTGGLLDVHIVTDRDIEKRTSFAVKIGAVTDAARPLPMKQP